MRSLTSVSVIVYSSGFVFDESSKVFIKFMAYLCTYFMEDCFILTGRCNLQTIIVPSKAFSATTDSCLNSVFPEYYSHGISLYSNKSFPSLHRTHQLHPLTSRGRNSSAYHQLCVIIRCLCYIL